VAARRHWRTARIKPALAFSGLTRHIVAPQLDAARDVPTVRRRGRSPDPHAAAAHGTNARRITHPSPEEPMLGTFKVVAFVPTTDFDRSRAFYEGVLGLRFVNDDGFAMVFDANGVMVRIARTPAFTPAKYTILGWQSDDIEATVAELNAHGVRFEHYGFPGQDESGIWTAPSGDKVAWFTDPDGNTLSISQHV
jgi:catechol 2,3-dioxygenase-like lactoylglutathione lyase family enzyme